MIEWLYSPKDFDIWNWNPSYRKKQRLNCKKSSKNKTVYIR